MLCPEYVSKYRSAIASETDIEAMLKYFRLIEAEIVTDNTVISLDDKVRIIFDKAATTWIPIVTIL
ncbi:MAG: hypothetical protein GDA48_06895 [Hormoscilla sp. GM102CHS1]|nr:hypothetical protein [Hormoscilla sp. GM102CHS1]